MITASSNLDSQGRFQPLYLYYLDRELRESIENKVADATLESVTRILLLGTPAPLYCGLSPVWEGTGSDLAQFFGQLVRAGHVELLSHYADMSSFVESKRIAYTHDVARYPMYFAPKNGSVRKQLVTTRFK